MTPSFGKGEGLSEWYACFYSGFQNLSFHLLGGKPLCQYNWDSSLHCHSFNSTKVLCHNFICLMLLIQGYVACLNLTLTGPMQCTQPMSVSDVFLTNI